VCICSIVQVREGIEAPLPETLWHLARYSGQLFRRCVFGGEGEGATDLFTFLFDALAHLLKRTGSIVPLSSSCMNGITSFPVNSARAMQAFIGIGGLPSQIGEPTTTRPWLHAVCALALVFGREFR